MPLDVTPELLDGISACAEIGNSVDQAAQVLRVTPDDLAGLLRDNAEARGRWERGGIEAVNQLKVCLTRQALAGSVQASKLLLQMRGELEKTAPTSSTTPSTANEKRRGAAWRWEKIAAVSVELQVSAQFIRNMTKDARNPLPCEQRAGDWMVKAGEAYDWICKHAKRRPPNLAQPRGYEESAQCSVPSAQLVLPAEFEISNDEDVLKILNSALNDKTSSAEQRRVLAALAGQMRLYFTEKFKREKMVPAADVVKMLRTFGELLVELIEDHAEPQAAELVKTVRDGMDTDLTTINPSAVALLKSSICEYANKYLIPAIQQRVRDEVDGVEVLQLGGEA